MISLLKGLDVRVLPALVGWVPSNAAVAADMAVACALREVASAARIIVGTEGTAPATVASFDLVALLPFGWLRPTLRRMGATPGPGSVAVMITGARDVQNRAIFNTFGGRLDPSEKEHGGTVKVFVPPELVGNGRFENLVPWLGRIVLRGDPCSELIGKVVISLGITAQSGEMLRPHSHIRRINEKPGLRSVCFAEIPDELTVIVKELRRSGVQQQKNCAKDTIAGPPMFEGWWSREFLAVP